MTENRQDNPDDRLEAMLGRWGADEAARTTPVPPPEQALHAPPRRRAVSGMLRWAPAAVAAAMLVAAGWLWLDARRLAGRVPAPTAAAPPTRPAPPEPAGLRAEAADLRQRLAEATERLAATDALGARLAELEGRLDRATARHATELGEALASATAAEAENRKLAEKLSAASDRLAELSEAKAAADAVAARVPKLEANAADLQRRLIASGDALDAARRAREEAVARLRHAAQRVELLQARHKQVVDAFQRTYLTSIAPGKRGLEARKAAARVRRMVERCNELLDDARGADTRKLLARLEVILTRLDLLNPDRAGVERAFDRLVEEGELGRQIDSVLTAGNESEAVRTWLFEAKLILTGDDDAS